VECERAAGPEFPFPLLRQDRPAATKWRLRKAGAWTQRGLISDGQSDTGIREILFAAHYYQPASLPLGSAAEVPLELACGQSRQCVDSIESGLTFGMER
jgi:hypothetical protein